MSLSIDARNLMALRSSESVSGADLSQQLGISRTAIWARIQDLRSLGYDVEASPHLGYRLLSSPDLLHADDLHARIGATKTVGREIHVFQETTSTNDVIEKFARAELKEGIVIFAESQTKGRGRLGRKWISPARKGLWFSILLRPNLRPQLATQLTIAAATALARAIELQTPLEPEIKWPNDILIRGRKVAGILDRKSTRLNRIRHVVLGIGIDVNLNANEFPPELKKIATSLKIETGRTVNRSELAAAVLRELDVEYERIGSGQFDSVAAEWEARCTTIGQSVIIRGGDRVIQGRAESLDAEGALLVRSQHGLLERVIGGDVVLEK